MNVLEEPSGAGCSNRGYGIFSEYGAKSMALPALRAGGYSRGKKKKRKKETDKHALSKYCQEEPKRTTVAGAASALSHLIHRAALWVSIPFTMRKPRLRDVKKCVPGSTVNQWQVCQVLKLASHVRR